MLEFNGMDHFVTFLEATVKSRLNSIPALEWAAQAVEEEAKKEIGTYQTSNMGPYEPWAELTSYTKEERVRAGFTENDPLLRSGELRNSISHETDISGNEAVIGSPLDKMVYLELGTKSIPPRPVLGLAAYRSRRKIVRLVGGATIAALLNVDFSPFSSVVFQHEGTP